MRIQVREKDIYILMCVCFTLPLFGLAMPILETTEKVVCAKDPLPKYLIDIKSHDGIDEEVRGGPIPAIDKCTAQVHVKSDDRWLIIAAGLPRTGRWLDSQLCRI